MVHANSACQGNPVGNFLSPSKPVNLPFEPEEFEHTAICYNIRACLVSCKVNMLIISHPYNLCKVVYP